MSHFDRQSALESLETLRDFVRYAASVFGGSNLFFGHGTSSALDEAAALVLFALWAFNPVPCSDLWWQLKTGELTISHRADHATIETFPNPQPSRDYEIAIACPEFTSLCPMTGHPDFAHITVRYVAEARTDPGDHRALTKARAVVTALGGSAP